MFPLPYPNRTAKYLIRRGLVGVSQMISGWYMFGLRIRDWELRTQIKNSPPLTG